MIEGGQAQAFLLPYPGKKGGSGRRIGEKETCGKTQGNYIKGR